MAFEMVACLGQKQEATVKCADHYSFKAVKECSGAYKCEQTDCCVMDEVLTCLDWNNKWTGKAVKCAEDSYKVIRDTQTCEKFDTCTEGRCCSDPGAKTCMEY